MNILTTIGIVIEQKNDIREGSMAEKKNGGKVDEHQEYSLLSQVAHMYYDLNMLQPEIAEKLYFSRSKVSRMLAQARNLGIVEIHVRRIVDRIPELEKKLKKTFGLKDAIVITGFGEEPYTESMQSLTDFASLYISGLIRGNCKIGISNGRTINAVVKKLRKQNPCALEVVQLIGSASNTNIAEESRIMAEKIVSSFSGKAYYLNTPMCVDDEYVKEILMREPSVKDVFDQMKTCDMLLTGVGALPDRDNGIPEWFGNRLLKYRDELLEQGAVGSVCAQYYDVNGKLTDSRWNRTCLAMPLGEVQKNGMTIGIAAGEEKARAILGALRGGILNVVITNAATAGEILDLQEKLNLKNESETLDLKN